MFDDCIIMAGGAGIRLWPASNSRMPKQFLSIPGGQSFFRAALDRALRVINIQGDGRVIIITGKSHVPHVIKACGEYEESLRSHFILIPEPAAKNTAPAIVCGTVYTDWVSARDRKVLVLTSDHIIRPMESFVADAEAASLLVEKGRLVVFGIPPRGPETGYGYVEAAKEIPLPSREEFTEAYGSGGSPKAYAVASFREKPDRKKAEEFLATGRFYWNSGMFAFSSRFIINEFRRNAPEVIVPFDKLRCPDDRSYQTRNGLRILNTWLDLDTAYAAVKSISFDYAIAEKSSSTAMVTAGFEWYDVGSWDEYARLTEKTNSEVYCDGASSCFVDSDIPVALAGVDDLIVVIRTGSDGTSPKALIMKKGETQRVRNLVEQIKEKGRTGLL